MGCQNLRGESSVVQCQSYGDDITEVDLDLISLKPNISESEVGEIDEVDNMFSLPDDDDGDNVSQRWRSKRSLTPSSGWTNSRIRYRADDGINTSLRASSPVFSVSSSSASACRRTDFTSSVRDKDEISTTISHIGEDLVIGTDCSVSSRGKLRSPHPRSKSLTLNGLHLGRMKSRSAICSPTSKFELAQVVPA